jgi:hypothetical protein
VKRSCAVLAFGFMTSISPGLGVARTHGPSLQETLDWLKVEINTKATNGGGGACVNGGMFASPCLWRYEATELSGCEVSWTFTQRSHAQRSFESEITEEIRMPLWEDFNPAPFASSGEGETWRVTLQMRDLSSQTSRVKRTLTFGSTTSVSVETRTFAEIHFGIPGDDNRETANHFAKALSHAVQLCQGRKPKSKTLF